MWLAAWVHEDRCYLYFMCARYKCNISWVQDVIHISYFPGLTVSVARINSLCSTCSVWLDFNQPTILPGHGVLTSLSILSCSDALTSLSIFIDTGLPDSEVWSAFLSLQVARFWPARSSFQLDTVFTSLSILPDSEVLTCLVILHLSEIMAKPACLSFQVVRYWPACLYSR